MSKRLRHRTGDFVAIPLPSGGFGYGRILEKLAAFYDLRTKKIVDIEVITGSEVIFKAAVHASAVSNDRWQIIGNRPLEIELREISKRLLWT